MSSEPGDGAFESFLSLSVWLTGFDRFDLYTTGVAREYWKRLNDGFGTDAMRRVLRRAETLSRRSGRIDQAAFRTLARDRKCGRIVRTIITMWYLGNWEPPGPTRGGKAVVSADAYLGGLVWKAIRVNPPGARGPGYGSWAEPPDDETSG